MGSRVRQALAVILAASAAAATGGGCARDNKVATAGPAGQLRLSAAREPFTFSSWDVGRVEWSAPPADPNAVPPDVAAVLANGRELPLRKLTLAVARGTPGLTVGPPARCDDGHGAVYDPATPVTASGFHFDFAGDRLVHFVAAGVPTPDGGVTQPVFHALAVDRRDANGDPILYAMPLGRTQCADLFGTTEGLQTDLALPAILP